MNYIKESDIQVFTARLSKLKDAHLHGGVVVKNGEFIQFYVERETCDKDIDVRDNVASVKTKAKTKK